MKSWFYTNTAEYGSPEHDVREDSVASTELSDDGLTLGVKLKGFGKGDCWLDRIYQITFPEAGDARLVRFNITSNHGGDNNFVGLSEVRFDGTQVPEPSAGILALIGLAGCLRRRR